MIDARFLVDVHFQQGKKHKDSFPAQAQAAEVPKAAPKPPSPEWHSEEEELGSSEHKNDAGTLH